MPTYPLLRVLITLDTKSSEDPYPLIESEDVSDSTVEALLGKTHALIVPGGFGERGIEGKIRACRYAREHNLPYLGICLGMQIAVIEFARHVCGLKDANSSEFDPKTPDPVIDIMPDQSITLVVVEPCGLGLIPVR